MSVIEWDSYGKRRFETGLDRGVLYVHDGPAVPWNGLTGLKDAPLGGEVTSRYFDGTNYVTTAESEAYQGTLTAFTYPPEFEVCLGSGAIRAGFRAQYQPKKSFDLTYRTLIGNDLESVDYGHKLHLVYNCLAVKQDLTYSTQTQAADPSDFSWVINGTPVRYPGIKPTAYFTLDSTELLPGAMAAVEEVLYGTDSIDPRMPTISEIVGILSEFLTLDIEELADGVFTAEGPDSMVYPTGSSEFAITVPPAEVVDEETYEVESF